MRPRRAANRKLAFTGEAMTTQSHKAAAIEFLTLAASGKVREAYQRQLPIRHQTRSFVVMLRP